MLYDDDENGRYDDVSLTPADVQTLSSAENVVAFFARLRYNTNEHVVQTPAAMGLTSASLSGNIQHIERIARNIDFDELEVYLFKLRSLTVASRNEIVQRFRYFAGNYLLVLTDDYERLDFVLLERYQPMITAQDEKVMMQLLPLPGNKPVNVRPHVLPVDRRNPDEVALRVLRRFTYTESDTAAQYEKLLNAYIVASWSDLFFNNRALFSDYYLKERLPEMDEWKNTLEYSRMRQAYRSLRKLYEEEDERRHETQAGTMTDQRATLFEPVLSILGFRAGASTRPRITTPDDPTDAAPDYFLFDAQKQVENDATEKPLALCLTYPWGRNLDGRDEQRDPQHADENPGAVVVTLLDSGQADWVIVTNGTTWRLYAAKAHSRATNYYEVNIPETLALDPSRREEGFRYFWLLFRAAAFIPTMRQVEGEARMLNLLDYLLIESDLHARALGERLKNRVFEQIFPHFARGFVSYARRRRLLPADLEALPADERNRLLEPYFNGTLTFLYRLLFLLYAESRDLLPVREERSYYEYSLERMRRQIADIAGNLQDRAAKNLERYSETETTLYDRLLSLFAAVDKGNRDLNVPLYNGGLFMSNPPAPAEDEPSEVTVARFLREHKIPDRYLALGLDLMARDIDEKLERVRQSSGETNEYSHALIAIDYKSLGVRHLGSIYEGLLEFKLRIAPETMAVVEGKRTEEVVPYEEAKRENRRILKVREGKDLKERLYPKGSIYLENDRRERKSTGSYYTPDYIVKYIVEQTVGPLLKKRLEDLRPVFREAQRDLEKQKNLARALHRSEAEAEQETYKTYQRTLNEVFFAIKVLDPAMGSGHFLVEVVDYITDQMAKWLNGFKWNPIVHELSLTRKTVEDAMKEQGVSVDMGKLTDLNLLKRRVLKSCIYGIDLNPMAVELAKVSLWLDCFTLGAPLSFLDHHIKCGNSLIGAEVKDVHRGIKESLFGYQFQGLLEAAKMMRNVSKLSDATAKEIAESRSAYWQAHDLLQPYKRLFDVWLSQYFGNNKKAQEIASEYAQAIVDANYSEIKNASDIATIQAAPAIAANKRFFHWELEFPEVYFGDAERKESGGFDAIVGNPPYDELSEEERGSAIEEIPYLQETPHIIPALGHRINLYRLFIARSLHILRLGGSHSFIVPLSLLADQFTFTLRKYLLERSQFTLIEQFPQKDDPRDRVFESAKLSTCLYVLRKIDPQGNQVYIRTHPGRDIQEDSPSYMTEQANFCKFDPINLSIPGLSEQAWNVVLKLAVSTRITKLANVAKALPGELMINRQFNPYLTDATHGEEIIRGSHIGMYKLVEPKQGEPLYLDREKYLAKHVNSVKAHHYLQERVVYQRYAAIDNYRRLIATILPAGFFCSHTVGYLADIKKEYNQNFLMALLNSKVLDWRFNLTSTNNNVNGYEVEALPVPSIKFITSDNDRARYRDQARLLYQQCLQEQGKPDCIMDFVKHHLAQQPEASDVVHDLLAYLAQEMLDLNKQKRALQKKFLEEYLVPMLHIKPDKSGKSGLDVLIGKGKLQDYPGDYQKGEAALDPDELWDIIRKNRTRLNVNLAQPGFRERIQARYQESLDEVLPLKEQLKHTDMLIDQVVYALYGLSEEEIAVVEGR